jgi:hypothetical protein
MIADLDGRLLPFGWAKLGWCASSPGGRSRRARACPSWGVMPQYKNKSMGSVLALLTVGAVRSASLKLGMPVAEMSWVLESNHQTRHSIESIGGRVYKTYRVYNKPL